MGNKKETFCWKGKIGALILSKRTYNMETDNPWNHPTIHYIIARDYLENELNYDQHRVHVELDNVVKKVKNNLEHTIDLLQDKGIPVYTHRNSKNTQVISIEEKWKEKDGERITGDGVRIVGAKKRQIVQKHPSLLIEWKNKIRTKISEK